MFKPAIILLLILAAACSQKQVQPDYFPVIPAPAEILPDKGNFTINQTLFIGTDQKELEETARLFTEQIQEICAASVSLSGERDVVLILDKSFSNAESYQLEIKKKQVKVTSSSPAGVFYGLQTLKQLMIFHQGEKGEIILPSLRIIDEPRFVWRGLMLDESRHFFGTEKVKQLLDMMALHKLNVFHWHLTDVPGWRIEIKKYPLLTTIGGVGNHIDPQAPASFYTQEEIREIVRYATERHIEIIPEIDMPGHAAAANRAYPEFSGGGSEKYPEFTFNPGKEETYGYLTDILREVAGLFPAGYIHLGGDEVHFGNESWKTNPDVLRLMKTHKLPDLVAVESYFVNRMADSIQALGKTVVGWDEVVDHHLSPEQSLVMWWRHNLPNKLEAALNQGFQVVLCPRIPLYFDFVQHESHQWGRKWAGTFSPVDMVHAFPPDTLPGISAHTDQIKGIQANIWTEQIQNNPRLDYMTYPRLSALAESGWSKPENKSFFDERLKLMLQYLEKQEIIYFNPFNPENSPEPPGVKK